MHAQHDALSLGWEASNSESINISKEPMRSTPPGANLQRRFWEAVLPFMRQGKVVFAFGHGRHPCTTLGSPTALHRGAQRVARKAGLRERPIS